MSEIEAAFTVTKKRDGLRFRHRQTGYIDYLDWWEGWLYRLSGRVPKRLYLWHEYYTKILKGGTDGAQKENHQND